MHGNDRKFIIIFILLGLASLISLSLFFKDFKQNDTVDIKDFPRTIDGWVSQDIPLSKQDLMILETNNVFVRKYISRYGEVVYLYVVYSQTNRKVSHPPEICYTGSGISILENIHDVIPVQYKNLSIGANRLLLKANGFSQISYYWFKAGDTFTSNYWKQQCIVAFNMLLGKKTGNALIRVSADIRLDDKQRSINLIKEFTNIIAPDLFKYLP